VTVSSWALARRAPGSRVNPAAPAPICNAFRRENLVSIIAAHLS
jgi:hypothetical protein